MEERDFYDLMWAYLESAKRDNIVHAEIFFDPQSHTERGVSFETCFQGLYKATQVSLACRPGIVVCSGAGIDAVRLTLL